MRQVRIFVGRETVKLGTISDSAIIKRIVSVMRLSKGSRILLIDGSGEEYDSEIIEIDKKSISFKILKTKQGLGFDKDLTLYMSLVKKDNFELITQKAVELGVKKVVPVLSQFCVKNEFSEKGLARLRSIVIEAVEQSEGSLLPEVVEPISFEQAIDDLPKQGSALMAQPRGLGKTFSKITFNEPLSVFVGPEGGYSEEEVKMAQERGIILVSLGSRILRAETAAISFLARLLID